VRQIGVRIEDPPANSMATFKFTSAVPSRHDVVFSSWVCVADGAGDFRRFTIDVMKPKTLAASFHSELDEFVNNLDDLSTHGSARKTEESVFNATPPYAATTTLGSDPLQSENLRNRSRLGLRNSATRRPTIPSPSPYWKMTWTVYSKSENSKPPHVGGLRVVLVTTV
jgi:hypothetical protein